LAAICGVARVDLSIDGGKGLAADPTRLPDPWNIQLFGNGRRNSPWPARAGARTLMVRCTNTKERGAARFSGSGNPAGYMFNTIENDPLWFAGLRIT